MFVYRIRVQGDTYKQYDGDIMIEVDSRCDELNKDLLINYQGKFDFSKIFQKYFPSNSNIAWKKAGKSQKVNFIGTTFSSILEENIERLSDCTLKVKKSEKENFEFFESKDNFSVYTTMMSPNWGVKDGVPEIYDIQNGVNIFVDNSDKICYIIFTECGISQRKIISMEDISQIIS